MNEADLELILAQYSYRSGHAMTTTEILAAKQKAVKEIIALFPGCKVCGVNCPKCYCKPCYDIYPEPAAGESKTVMCVDGLDGIHKYDGEKKNEPK
jgi:hypothetical protein